ncbi:hypothetical protein BHM03_00025302 [Ensete ventricosum]|nr:hypothetical protein BHM03_00025302 [Ensete ventricosum]
MRLRAVIAVGGEEEMRRVRCGAVVADVDDSGCDWKQRRKKMVASSSGREEQSEGSEQRSSRGIGDGFGRKNIAVVGLKRAARATTNVATGREEWLMTAIEEESKAVVKVG